MKVKILKKKKNEILFSVEGATPAFANALRRIMISEIPTLAVEWVDFHDNTSALFDEIVAQRMGLIPLEFDPKKFNLQENCRCGGKGCSLCQVTFSVTKTGPRIVYSGDLKSSNKGVKPTDPRFPIVELLKNQKISFEAVSVLGVGTKHAKWQAANSSYYYLPELEFANGKGDYSKVLKSYPKGVLTKKGKIIVLNEPERVDIDELKRNFGLRVRNPEGRFVFRVESISGLKPDYIVSKAAEILQERAAEFKKLASKI